MTNVNPRERDALLRLGELLKAETGISLGGLKPELVHARLSRRMNSLGIRDLPAYVTHLDRGRKDELQLFINLMTTNHTYFFREKPHLDFIVGIFLERFFRSGPRPLNIWCAACSTGEEVHTVAMLVHAFLERRAIKSQVSILGTDINTEALRIAANGVYPARRLESVPANLRRKYFKQGKVPHDKYFRANDELRKLTRFVPGNLLMPVKMFQRFDLVLCRNVMLYFEQNTVREVVRFLVSTLADDGILITGLSEKIDNLNSQLHLLGRSIHSRDAESIYRHQTWECRPLEDSLSLVRGVGGGRDSLGEDASAPIEIASPPAGRTTASSTSSTSLDAANRDSAQDLLAPSRGSAATSLTRGAIPNHRASSGKAEPIVAIGASTGGQDALMVVLKDLPVTMPPIVVAQHIAAGYSKSFVDSLARHTQLRIKEAEQGETLLDGTVYVAPGGQHLEVVRRNERLTARLRSTSRPMPFTPSVDLLFESLLAIERIQVIAVILTGMGDDGAKGLRALKDRGYFTLAQDRETSLVYGMPGSAVEAGGVTLELPLEAIGRSIVNRVRRESERAA